MENTRIAWAHNTQNFFVGCDQIAPECAHCYINRELRKQTEPTTGEKRKSWGEVYRTKTTWSNPAKWQKQCAAEGVCRRVFTNSLSDFFHVKGDPWRAEAWDVIRATPNLVWLILTKRPELILSRLPADWGDGYPNVWLGVSTACNMTLNKMESLRKIPAALRFVSCEPLLEDIASRIDLTGFQWVIAGGESGTGPEYLWDPTADWKKELYTGGRRTMKLEWAAALRDKAHAQNALFFFKQITAARSEQGIDALGQIYHEMPDPPHSRWAEGDVMQTKDEKKLVRKLRSALGNTYRLSKTTKDELSNNPTWGPYKVCQGNTVKDSGTLEDLFARVSGKAS
jgi:protein gp37